jgi:hypothetical protein
MVNVAFLRSESLEARDRHLGPAEVLSVAPDGVEVRIESGAVVRAVIALAVGYEPEPGDLVLVIGDAGRAWVIGVLSSSGKAALTFTGDVDLRSIDGTVRISGAKGVEMDTPSLTMRLGKLHTVAESVVEHVVSLRQRVKELLSVHAGEQHTIVDGATVQQSKSATIVTEEKVTINGKAIYLG